MMRKLPTGMLALLVAMMTATTSTADDGASVQLIVAGAEPGEGRVLASLYDSEENHMGQGVARAQADVDAEGRAALDLGRHAPGDYSIAVYYDRNSNGELDTGLFGIPKEKVGFSNNAKGRFGPAKWKDARFELGHEDLEVEIQLGKAAKQD